jgi:hypothetical protein
LRRAAAERAPGSTAFVGALSRSLGLDDQLTPQGPLIQAALDGLELRLLQGAAAPETEEAYHRFWLSLVP